MSAQPPLQITWPQPGEVIEHGRNRYLVGELLGQGAFGCTYACIDQWNNSLVIKVHVPRGQTYQQVRQNWERELRSLFTLRHPNITYIYDAFERNATFHIVMERCGGSLGSLLAAPNYDGLALLLPIARCVLQGIAYMHDNGYVHKDIHLGNVFWAQPRNEIGPSDGQSLTFKVGDLGICRLESELDFYTTTLAQWMLPPEFLRPGEFGAVGKQTDIYHAGLLLLSVAAGRAPALTNEQILQGVPQAVAARLPPPLGLAISKALRRHTSARTQTAFEFWQDLIGRGAG
jgi:serine/threonine-protein kinase